MYKGNYSVYDREFNANNLKIKYSLDGEDWYENITELYNTDDGKIYAARVVGRVVLLDGVGGASANPLNPSGLYASHLGNAFARLPAGAYQLNSGGEKMPCVTQ